MRSWNTIRQMQKNFNLAFAYGPVVGAILSVISIPLMLLTLDKADIGRYSYYFALCNISSQLVSLGLDHSIIRFSDTSASAWNNLVRSSILSNGLIIILGIVLALFYSGELAVFIFFGAVLTNLIRYAGAFFRVEGRAVEFNFLLIIPRLVVVLSFLYLWLTQIESTHLFVIISYLVGLSVCVVLFLCLGTLNNRDKVITFRLREVAEHIKYAIPIWGVAIVSVLMINFDKILLSKIFDYETLGIYTLGYNLMNGLMLISVVFSTIYVPFAINNIPKHQYYRNRFTVILTFIYMTLATFGSYILTVAVGNFFPDYNEVADILLLLLTVPLLAVFIELKNCDYYISKKTAWIFVSQFFALFLFIAAVAVLYKQLNLVTFCCIYLLMYVTSYILRLGIEAFKLRVLMQLLLILTFNGVYLYI